MEKYKKPLKFIWNSFRGHERMFYIFFVGKIIEGAFYVLIPILAKLEMDQLVEKDEQLFGFIELSSFNIFLVILFIIFTFRILENLLLSLLEYFQFDYIQMYDNYYSQALHKRLEGAEPGIFLNARNKRFIGDIFGNSKIVGEYIRKFIGDVATYTFVIIGITTVLTYINIWIFVILILSGFIIYIIEKIREKYSENEDFQRKYEFDDKIRILSGQMETNFSNLVSSGGFNKVLGYYNEANEQLRKKIKATQSRVVTLNILLFFTENISEFLVKIIIGYSIFYTTGSIGTMTMVMLYLGKLKQLMYFFRRFKFSINKFIDSLLKLDLFLSITEVNNTRKNDINNFDKITFKNISFSYPNFAKNELKFLTIIENRIKSYSGTLSDYEKDQLHLIEEAKKEVEEENSPILTDINLELELGKTYGLVGKNGAGKTTFIYLLLNYFNNYSGNIFIENNELKDVKRDFFIENISIVNQVPYIIEGFSIRENLLLGVDKEYSDDYIIELLEKFGLKNKILKYRNGLDSEIGYDNDFSGGEKQLLVLIRVILQNKKILIMDEGTNQLDAENEILVMNELLKHKINKIVIFITHRMTTIRKVDIIYCLENGKITTKGTHKELIGKNNVYNNFWKKQVEL